MFYADIDVDREYKVGWLAEDMIKHSCALELLDPFSPNGSPTFRISSIYKDNLKEFLADHYCADIDDDAEYINEQIQER